MRVNTISFGCDERVQIKQLRGEGTRDEKKTQHSDRDGPMVWETIEFTESQTMNRAHIARRPAPPNHRQYGKTGSAPTTWPAKLQHTHRDAAAMIKFVANATEINRIKIVGHESMASVLINLSRTKIICVYICLFEHRKVSLRSSIITIRFGWLAR